MLRFIAVFVPCLALVGLLWANDRKIDSIGKRSIMDRGNFDSSGNLNRDVLEDLKKFNKSLLDNNLDYTITENGEIVTFDKELSKELGLEDEKETTKEKSLCQKCQAYSVYKILGDRDRKRLNNLYSANKDFEKNVNFEDLSKRAKLANNIYYIKEYLRVLDAKVENYDAIMQRMGCEELCQKN